MKQSLSNPRTKDTVAASVPKKYKQKQNYKNVTS